ncbi:sphingomyelin phosphodiesterase [Entamoeba marina]
MVTIFGYDIEVSHQVLVAVAVVFAILILILIGTFILQCYHRNWPQLIKELFIKDNYATDKFRMLSYNLCLHAPFVNNTGDDFKNIRLELFIRNVLPNFDIVCLQDVVGAYSARRGHLLECAGELGFSYSLVSITPLLPCFICDGGLIILSKIPIKKRDQYVFKSKLYPQSLLSRGVLYSKLSPNESSSIHLFTTHLHPINQNFKSNIIRQQQLAELVSFIKQKTKNDTHPIIVCGDFSLNALEKAEMVAGESFWNSSETNETECSKEFVKYVEEQTDDYIGLMYYLSEIGSVKDVIYNNLHRHPVTTGDTYYEEDTELPLETILTPENDLLSKRCEDFIFVISRGKNLVEQNSSVHTFDVNDQEFNFLSSHYGLSCEFEC